MSTMKRTIKLAIFFSFVLGTSSGKKILIADTAICYMLLDYIITSTGEMKIDDVLSIYCGYMCVCM